jgi:hypothetical protein
MSTPDEEFDPTQLPGYDEAEDGMAGDPDEAEGAAEDDAEDDGLAAPDDPHAAS